MSRFEDKTVEIRRWEIKANDEFRLNKRHTEKEWNYLLKAAECCREVSDMCRGYPDLQKVWMMKSEYFEKKADQSRLVLDEEKKTSTEKSDTGPKETKRTEEKIQYTERAERPEEDTGGFTSRNASKEVPLEMIKGWYQEKPDHGLDEVVGMDDLKEEVRKVILDSIGWEKLEKKYKMPILKSYMFYGPFGTGKTYFVEGLAKELMDRGFKFLKLDGTDLHGKYVGSGEKALKAAFQEAIDCAPSLLFFDEFDNVCVQRDSKTIEGHEKRLTNEFIQAFNDLKSSNKMVIFMAATNYPDKIDGAMLSRILSFFLIPLPSEEMREKYFENNLRTIVLEEGVSYSYMADLTDNYSVRDLDKIAIAMKTELFDTAKSQFGIRDENGVFILEESVKRVDEALSTGKVRLTKELFDRILEKNPPEKKDDILASLRAFEAKQ